MGKTEKISFRIEKEDREKLKDLANIDQMKDSDYLRRLVRWAISKNKRFTK